MHELCGVINFENLFTFLIAPLFLFTLLASREFHALFALRAGMAVERIEISVISRVGDTG